VPKIVCSVPRSRKRVRCRVVNSARNARVTLQLRRQRRGRVLARAIRTVQRGTTVTLSPARRLRSGRYLLTVVAGTKPVARIVITV
jgi:hypothetical protein